MSTYYLPSEQRRKAAQDLPRVIYECAKIVEHNEMLQTLSCKKMDTVEHTLPCFAFTEEIFFMAMDLSNLPAACRDSDLLLMVEKYVPYMFMLYGNEDKDVHKNIIPMLKTFHATLKPEEESIKQNKHKRRNKTNKKKKKKQ